MKFNRITVVEKLPPVRHGQSAKWMCLCECGNRKALRGPDLIHGRVKSCGCLHREVASKRGPKHPHWRGGNYVTNSGYVMQYAPDHPRAKASKKKKGQGAVLEHILVMESILGRYLLPGENVHHKNGVRADNRPENLELWLRKQPGGQRVEDLVEWAVALLRVYKPSALADVGYEVNTL